MNFIPGRDIYLNFYSIIHGIRGPLWTRGIGDVYEKQVPPTSQTMASSSPDRKAARRMEFVVRDTKQ